MVDFSRKSQKYLERWFTKQRTVDFPNHCMDVQLIVSKIIIARDSKLFIFVCGHHMIMDGSALMFFMEYLDKVYAALRDGSPLPPEGCNPIYIVEQSFSYSLFEKKQKNDAWWQDHFNTEPKYTSFNGKNEHEIVRGKKYARPMHLWKHKMMRFGGIVPSELVTRIRTDVETRHIFIQIYYIFAIRSYMARICKNRRYNDTCCFVRQRVSSTKKLRTQFGKIGISQDNYFGKKSVSDGLTDVNIELFNDMLHSEYSGAQSVVDGIHSRFGTPANADYWSVIISYQAECDINKSTLGYKLDTTNIGKVAPCPLYMHILPADKNGDITINYLYGKGYLKKSGIEKFHAFFLRFIPYILEHPESTVEKAVNAAIL